MPKIWLEVSYEFTDCFCDFRKCVKWPWLLPLGSGVFPDDGKGNLDAMEIESYCWFEEMGYFSAYMKPNKNNYPMDEGFPGFMKSLGWKPNGSGRKSPKTKDADHAE